MKSIVQQHGEPPAWQRPEGFSTLLHIILEQQVSLASARYAFERLCERLPELTPEAFLTLTDAELKTIGFSRQKTGYGRALARALKNGELNLEALNELPGEAANAQLTRVKGVGPWTANIYLLMALGRPDVWPPGDLALATSAKNVKGLAARPSQEALAALAGQWRPYRSYAARLLWHHFVASLPVALKRSYFTNSSANG